MTDNGSNKQVHKGMGAMKTGGSSGVWFLGFVGALIYYLHVHSGSFGLVIAALFKAVLWPAFLVYHLLQFLGM